MSKRKARTESEMLLLAGANSLGTLMSEEQVLFCVIADGLAAKARAGGLALPVPECEADELVVLLLGQRAKLYWLTPELEPGHRYDWRAAHRASWSVAIACCIKCRRDEFGSGGLTCRHTSHRACWPEAWAKGDACRCAVPCSPCHPQSEDAP